MWAFCLASIILGLTDSIIYYPYFEFAVRLLLRNSNL